MGASSILGGMLVGLGQGYVQQKERKHAEELEAEKQKLQTLQHMLQYGPASYQAFAVRELGKMSGEMKPANKEGKQVAQVIQQMVPQVAGEMEMGRPRETKLIPRYQEQQQPTMQPPPRIGIPATARPLGGPPRGQFDILPPPQAALGTAPQQVIEMPPTPSGLPADFGGQLEALTELAYPRPSHPDPLVQEILMEDWAGLAHNARMQMMAYLLRPKPKEEEEEAGTGRKVAAIQADPNLDPKVKQALITSILSGVAPSVLLPPQPGAENLSFEEAQFEDMKRAEVARLGHQLTDKENADLRSKVRASLADPEIMEMRKSMLELSRQSQQNLQEQRNFERTARLRDDYEQAIRNDKLRADGYKDLLTATQSGAGDLVILYQFIKMQDPNAVREGEIALTERARGSIPEWIIGAWEKVSQGQAINPATRKRLIEQAHTQFKGSIQPRLTQATKLYTDRARKMGLEPLDIVRPSEEFSVAPQTIVGPPPGTPRTAEEYLRRHGQ